MDKKRIADSATTQVQIVMQEHINGMGRLFGGRLVEWIDVVAAVTARRHSGREVTTVCMENLIFDEPAYANDTVVLKGKIACVGTTSMDVRVDTYVEPIGKERRRINTAYLVMVAIDENERTVPVPGLLLETEEDRREWDLGVARRARRKFSPTAK